MRYEPRSWLYIVRLFTTRHVPTQEGREDVGGMSKGQVPRFEPRLSRHLFQRTAIYLTYPLAINCFHPWPRSPSRSRK